MRVCTPQRCGWIAVGRRARNELHLRRWLFDCSRPGARTSYDGLLSARRTRNGFGNTESESSVDPAHFLFPNPVGFFAIGLLSPRNRTPSLSGEVHTTCTSRFVPSNVSMRTNCLGSHSPFERMSSAPPLERSAIRHEKVVPLASSMRPGRLTGCLVSLRIDALRQRLQSLDGWLFQLLFRRWGLLHSQPAHQKIVHQCTGSVSFEPPLQS